MIRRGRTVSVVIPTRDRPQLLSQALRSVLAQCDVDVEIVVVDDGSAAGTVAAALPPDDRVHLVRHDVSRGVSEARNTGVRTASEEWVAFLDDDDVWAPDKLAAQLDALAAEPKCGWSHVGGVVVDDHLEILGWFTPPPERDISVQIQADNILWSPSGVMVARDLLAAAGPFDPALSCCADWDMFLRLAQRSPLASVARPLLGYRIHSSAMTIDLGACSREMEVISERYASLRAVHGTAVDRARWEQWKAATYLRAGKRGRSLRALYAWARLERDWYRFARSAALTMLPGAAGLRDRRQKRRVPAPWRAEAEAWLAGLAP